MSNASLGHAGVMLAFAGSLFGAITMVTGVVRNRTVLLRQSVNYVWLLVAGALVAVIAMEHGLLSHDFSMSYVAQHSSRETPLLFLVAGMWAALEGSILLWGVVLTAYIATMIWHFRRRRDDRMVAWATAIAFMVSAFFFGLMLGPADPFRVVSGAIPVDGPGPNPLLQNHILMAFHPPILYAGYVGFTVPFSFGMAALITGRVGEGWLVETRRWSLVAWGFLSVGIVLGSWWSYEVLGWGGYWSWDPVENASFLPWLTATAYLHSVMVQERRAMLRVWNLSLLSATFALTVLGTFFTRSGVLDSVHAFTESQLGPWLLGAFAVVVITTCALVFWRSDKLGSPGAIGSRLSREAAFLANNIAFAAFAFVVLLGTVFPLIAEAVQGARLSIGQPYFDGMTRPIGMVLLFLMAVAPVLTWRNGSMVLLRQRMVVPTAVTTIVVAASVALGLRGLWVLLGLALGCLVASSAVRQLVLSVRSRGWAGLVGRANGGMIAHLGIAVIAVALTMSQGFVTRGELTLKKGESGVVDGHKIELVDVRAQLHPNRASTVAVLKLDGGKTYSPALSKFPNSTDAIGTPSVATSPIRDVYLTLVRAPMTSGGPSVISVVVQPMVSWLWAGGGLIALGTVASLIGRRPNKSGVSAAQDDLPTSVDESGDEIEVREPVHS